MAKAGRKQRPRLTIGVDCGSLSSMEGGYYGGISSITRAFLEAASTYDKRNKYILYSFAPLNFDFPVSFQKRVTYRVLPKTGFSSVWTRVALKRDEIDVFLALSQVMPNGAPNTLGFIYDVAFLTKPEYYSNAKQLEKNTRHLANESCHIITTSDASAKDIVDHLGIKDKKITVSYPGALSIFSPRGPKYVDTQAFFLYVGGMRASKNVPFLLRAFAMVVNEYKAVKLVLVGGDGRQDPKIAATIRELKLEKQVEIKGFVDEKDLPKYYRGAVAFVSPALYEGFGFPILEAMSCGTPVIVGNTGSQPEIVGKAGICVSVDDKTALKDAMIRVLTDEKQRAKYVKISLIQSARFKNKTLAKDILESIYAHCVSTKSEESP